jgi:hypothetical protein
LPALLNLTFSVGHSHHLLPDFGLETIGRAVVRVVGFASCAAVHGLTKGLWRLPRQDRQSMLHLVEPFSQILHLLDVLSDFEVQI